MESMNPDTRARMSTVANASKRPVYSSHSVMDFCSGFETVTGGGGGGPPATGLLSQPARTPAQTAATRNRAALTMGAYFMKASSTRKGLSLLFIAAVWTADAPLAERGGTEPIDGT